jgi:hypothetical protein
MVWLPFADYMEEPTRHHVATHQKPTGQSESQSAALTHPRFKSQQDLIDAAVSPLIFLVESRWTECRIRSGINRLQQTDSPPTHLRIELVHHEIMVLY